MNYKFIHIIIFLFLLGCVNYPIEKPTPKVEVKKNFYTNKGFALVYNKNLLKTKMDDRSLIILQKNLKNNTKVKITNLLNSKTVIAKVGKKTKYPNFYNSVITKRIADELEININEPYVEIIEIVNNSFFVAKEAKTHDEEKQVATKAPIDDIKIKNLSSTKKKVVKSKIKEFIYIIKIADFYFENSANQMKERIINETSLKNVNIRKITARNFRVFLGPYNDLNSLKNSFNAISVLEFDNLEVIKK